MSVSDPDFQNDQYSEEEVVEDILDMPDEVCKVWAPEYKKTQIGSGLEAGKHAIFIKSLEKQIQKIEEYKDEVINKCNGAQQKLVQKMFRVNGRLAQWVGLRGEPTGEDSEKQVFLPGLGHITETGEDSICIVFDEKNCLASLEETGVDADCVDSVLEVYIRDKVFMDNFINILKNHGLRYTLSKHINRNDLCEVLKNNPKCAASAKLLKEKNTCVIDYDQKKKKKRQAA